jgi:hypothetical protein
MHWSILLTVYRKVLFFGYRTVINMFIKCIFSVLTVRWPVYTVLPQPTVNVKKKQYGKTFTSRPE